MNEETLFPLKYWMFKDEHYRSNRKEILSFIDCLREEYPDNVSKSNAGGWQSENFHPQFKPALFEGQGERISNFILDSIRELTNPMFTPKMQGAWVNINGKGNYNEAHNHPRTTLAACYYVRVPDKSGSFYFVNSIAEKDPINFLLKEPIMKSEHEVYPWEGTLLVFPATLMHRVGKSEAESDRISIAYNIEVVLGNVV